MTTWLSTVKQEEKRLKNVVAYTMCPTRSNPKAEGVSVSGYMCNIECLSCGFTWEEEWESYMKVKGDKK
jgi:hypothetical protein